MRRFTRAVMVGVFVTAVAAALGASGGATTDSAAHVSDHRGGTLKLAAAAAAGTIDPHVNYTDQYWQLLQGSYDGLLAFRKAGGPAGAQVVPDLAVKVPTPTNGGKRWVFRLRKGIRFSNGQPLTTADVVTSFRRIFKVKSPVAGTFYAGIVGAGACINHPASCTLKGGVSADADAGTVTINLVAPDPEFEYRLAVPTASIVPASTPPRDSHTKSVPGTGAYSIASYRPNHELVMKRNPYFKEWSKAAQPDGYPDEIVESFGLPVESQVTEIERGQADWTYEAIPPDRLTEIGTKYQSQVHITRTTVLWFLPLNVNVAPFDNVEARRALNFAVDRNALVKLFGGSRLASPTCQILPPGLPGHHDYCPYTKHPGAAWSAPDVAKAKALVRSSGTAGQRVTVVTTDDDVNRAIGVYLQTVLNQIGYRAAVKPIAANVFLGYTQNSKNKVQLSLQQFYQDYPTPSDFLYTLFGCESFHRASDSNPNFSGFCDRRINARMHEALATAVKNEGRANAMWSGIDRMVTDKAPLVALFNPKHLDFVSKRVANFVVSPQYHWLVGQSWLK